MRSEFSPLYGVMITSQQKALMMDSGAEIAEKMDFEAAYSDVQEQLGRVQESLRDLTQIIRRGGAVQVMNDGRIIIADADIGFIGHNVLGALDARMKYMAERVADKLGGGNSDKAAVKTAGLAASQLGSGNARSRP